MKKNKETQLLKLLVYSRKEIIKLDKYEEAKKIPYVKNIPKDGRIIYNYSFYDHDKDDWIRHIHISGRRLGRIAGGQVVVGGYLASNPEKADKDLEFPLGTFIIQHLSFRKIINVFSGLIADFHNCSSILQKYILISSLPQGERVGAEQLLLTELEYLLVIIRSIYDLVQKISKFASELIKYPNEPYKPMVSDLPNSFAKVVLHGSQSRSSDEINKKYNLPPPIADFYFKESKYFIWLRDLRDMIEHHGKSPGLIFDTKDGFAIKRDESPWSNLPIWKPNILRPNGLGPLRAVFLYLISEAFELTKRYKKAYSSCIAVPPAIGPGYKYYIRDYFSHHLVSLGSSLKIPWERTNI